jgi:hypothetical protein
MADFTVSSDIDVLLQSGSNVAARSSLGLGTAATTAAADYATAAQGALADSAQQPPVEGPFVDGDKTKLDANTTKLAGIEAGAEVNTIESILEAGMDNDAVVLNVVSVSQADYNAGTKIGTTLYIIT